MTKRLFHLDFETRSRVDLRVTTAYRYAEDPSTEIFMCSVREHGTPRTLVAINPKFGPSEPGALEMLREAFLDTDALLAAHNYEFEHAVALYKLADAFGLPRPDISRWRCTAAMARNLNFPFQLGQLGEFLGVKAEKDKRGSALIQLFSVPQRDGRFVEPHERPAEWAEFVEYCRRDTDSESEIHDRLVAQPFDLASFQTWGRINERGFPVDMRAVRHVVKVVERIRERDTPVFERRWGVKPSQRAKCEELANGMLDAAWGIPEAMADARAKWDAAEAVRKQAMKDKAEDGKLKALKARCDELALLGWHAPNLQSATVDALLERDDLPADARALLTGYAALQGAAVDKLYAFMRCANSDGRIRGSFMWSGTLTGRASARGVQPQNMKKPSVPDPLFAYGLLRSGATEEEIEALWCDHAIIEVIGSVIRNFIGTAAPLMDCDYAAVEARGVCWVAGQDDAVQRLRDFDAKKPGAVEPYCWLASAIFKKPVEKGTDGGKPRQLGKQGVLGCIAEGTKVVTSRGLVPIELVTGADTVWDGKSWVSHSGVVNKGCKPVRNLFGVSLTDDHLVLCGKTFRRADEVACSGRLASLALATGRGHFASWDSSTPNPAMGAGSTAALSQPSSCASHSLRTTYDILDCGHRNRFVVVSDEGVPLTVHNCGYGMGRPKFKATCHKYGMKWVDDALSDAAVTAYREAHPKVRAAWYAAGDAARRALSEPGVTQAFCEGRAAFRYAKVAGVPCLQLRLPSGRRITYPRAKPGEENDILFWGEGMNGRWGWQRLYGPLLIENLVQGLCSDLLDTGLAECERRGVPACLVVHDQALGEGGTEERLAVFRASLETLPAWARGFPLKAEGGLVEFYMKD